MHSLQGEIKGKKKIARSNAQSLEKLKALKILQSHGIDEYNARLLIRKLNGKNVRGFLRYFKELENLHMTRSEFRHSVRSVAQKIRSLKTRFDIGSIVRQELHDHFLYSYTMSDFSDEEHIIFMQCSEEVLWRDLHMQTRDTKTL